MASLHLPGIVRRGQHYHRELSEPGIRFNATQSLHAIDLGHADIQQNEIRTIPLEGKGFVAPEKKIEKLLAIAKAKERGIDTSTPQILLDEEGMPIIVVSDQNCRGRGHKLSLKSAGIRGDSGQRDDKLSPFAGRRKNLNFPLLPLSSRIPGR